jgi:hypothetical protein
VSDLFIVDNGDKGSRRMAARRERPREGGVDAGEGQSARWLVLPDFIRASTVTKVPTLRSMGTERGNRSAADGRRRVARRGGSSIAGWRHFAFQVQAASNCTGWSRSSQ